MAQLAHGKSFSLRALGDTQREQPGKTWDISEFGLEFYSALGVSMSEQQQQTGSVRFKYTKHLGWDGFASCIDFTFCIFVGLFRFKTLILIYITDLKALWAHASCTLQEVSRTRKLLVSLI